MEDFEKSNKGGSGNGREELPAKREAALSANDEPKAARSSSGSSRMGATPPPAGASDGRLVFHYSREHRLAHASPEVRRIHEEGYQLNKGFIKGLTGNAGLRSTFMVIIILCAAIGLISFFGPSSDEGKFCGADAALKAFSFGENVFVSLSIDKSEDEKSAAALPAMVAAELSLLDGDGAVLSEAIVTGWYSGDEAIVLRYSFPDYDGKSVAAALFRIGADDEEGRLELAAKISRE